MQPMLFVAPAEPGLLYVNGRFVGEADEARPHVEPVSPYGAVYLQLYPISDARAPMARRLTLSAGRPVADSLAAQSGVSVALWPGGVVEVELAPPRLRQRAAFLGAWRAGDLDVRAYEGRVELAGRCEHPLPEGALAPECASRYGRVCLCGALEGGGRYAMAFSRDGANLLLSETGAEATWTDSGALKLLRELGDTVGHARLETWTPDGDGYALSGVEPMWSPGAPRWPATPEATALAAVEAARLGLWDEAAGYLAVSPSPCMETLRALAECDGCVPLRFPHPDGRPAVGVVELVTERCVRVRPLAYRAVPGGGAQGSWRVETLEAL